MNKPIHLNTEDYIASLIVRARQAQNIASGYSQEKVDELVTAIVWNIVKDGP